MLRRIPQRLRLPAFLLAALAVTLLLWHWSTRSTPGLTEANGARLRQGMSLHDVQTLFDDAGNGEGVNGRAFVHFWTGNDGLIVRAVFDESGTLRHAAMGRDINAIAVLNTEAWYERLFRRLFRG